MKFIVTLNVYGIQATKTEESQPTLFTQILFFHLNPSQFLPQNINDHKYTFPYEVHFYTDAQNLYSSESRFSR